MSITHYIYRENERQKTANQIRYIYKYKCALYIIQEYKSQNTISTTNQKKNVLFSFNFPMVFTNTNKQIKNY